jgi:hypothetical protein
MASTPIPAPHPSPEPARRTRKADAWTDLFFVITSVFGVWAVALVILTMLTIIEPRFLYSDQKVTLKAIGASAVGILALFQGYTMGAAMGQVPRFGIQMKYLMRSHRYMGRITLLLAAVIAYFCMTDIGAPTSPLTSALHGIFGSTAFLAIAVKLGLLKWRPTLAYDLAPWLGRYAAFAFVVVWITSVLAFYTDVL